MTEERGRHLGTASSATGSSATLVGRIGSLESHALQSAYRSGDLTPDDLVARIYDAIGERGDDSVWISTVPRDDAIATARALRLRWSDADSEALPPLYGLPFAVKDNIDVAGLATTAGSPGFAFLPERTAPIVERLIEAGAILIGKANLDQFATGLNGTRSPYGAPSNPFRAGSISGGSSSGSAVAVSAGLVTFSLGTDTAGSGRVPAALTNLVGMKPSRGLLSMSGVVPACPSLDCPSVFALTVADGARVLHVIAGFDETDAWSRRVAVPPAVPVALPLSGVAFAVPTLNGTDFAEESWHAAWKAILDRLTGAGAKLVPVDMTPFFEAGRELYGGPWLAERLAGLEAFVDDHPSEIFPVVGELLQSGKQVTGTDTFRGIDLIQRLRRITEPLWSEVSALLTPTVTQTFSIEEMVVDPIALNARLGRFTTFTNLLDHAAIAMPGGFAHEPGSAPFPFGITISAPAGLDDRLAGIATSIERLVAAPLGATGVPAPPSALRPSTRRTATGGAVTVAVVGAHLRGMPLHAQLVAMGASFRASTRTAPVYRLYALAGTSPAKPGLVRTNDGGGSIEVELYDLSPTSFGLLTASVASPLAIGTVLLDGGESCHGFICEAAAAEQALDITEFGGWRRFVASNRA